MTAPRNLVLVGDAAQRLRDLPDGSVDCVITSPPYYQLRDYGVLGQIGLESSVVEWAESLRLVMVEVARVLRPTGSVWLNLSDSYSRHPRYGAPPKSLLLGPERLLLALLADGWICRNKIVWSKTNPMPHSVMDRLNTTHEVVYFLSRQRSYYFDLDSIREPHRSRGARRARPEPSRPAGWAGPLAGSQAGLRRARAAGIPGHPLGKNPGDVWRLAASNNRRAHFATFPEALVERPLLASCPEAVCSVCGSPWRASTARGPGQMAGPGRAPEAVRRQRGELRPSCGCRASSVPGLVLDPFFGSGTVGVVARRHGRDWVGIELNPEYARMAEGRLAGAAGSVVAA